VTTMVTTDISPVPLFWLAALAFYFFSLVLAFARVVPPWKGRWRAAIIVQLLAAAALVHPLWMFFFHVVRPPELPANLAASLASIGAALVLIGVLLIPHGWTLAAQLASLALVAVLLMAAPDLPLWVVIASHVLAC